MWWIWQRLAGCSQPGKGQWGWRVAAARPIRWVGMVSVAAPTSGGRLTEASGRWPGPARRWAARPPGPDRVPAARAGRALRSRGARGQRYAGTAVRGDSGTRASGARVGQVHPPQVQPRARPAGGRFCWPAGGGRWLGGAAGLRPVAGQEQVHQLVQGGGADVAGDDGHDGRIARGGFSFGPGEQAVLAAGGGPPGGLGAGAAGQVAQLAQSQVHQDLGRLPGPAGHHAGGDQPPARLTQRVVAALRRGPGVFGAGLFAQGR